MKDKSKLGIEVLQAAALVGILGDALLRQFPWGINVTLFLTALAAAYLMLVRRHRGGIWTPSTIALNGALVFFGAMFAWRDSQELRAYDVMATFAILALMIIPSLGVKFQFAGVAHYFLGFIWSAINSLLGPFYLLLVEIQWKSAPKSGWKSGAVAVVRGLLLVTPMIVIFGALFMAADAVFEGIVNRTFRIDPSVIFSHVLLTGFLCWITAGYLRGAMFEYSSGPAANVVVPEPEVAKAPVASVTENAEHLSDEPAPKTESAPPARKFSFAAFDNSLLPGAFTLGAIEITIILGLVNLLFLSFVVIQVPYLFGGLELVQNTPDFKLATYARRGFGELVAVAALVLPILLGSHWLLRRDKPVNEKIFRVLAGIQIMLLFVIMASAAQRLFILTGNLGYGLTTTRFYPFMVMVWLAIVFIWFGATVLRDHRNNFAWGAFWSALVILGGLHFFNPDAYIVRSNLRLNSEGRTFDASYNSRLSDDAIPVLLENMEQLSPPERELVVKYLSRRLCENRTETDYRSFNFSRFFAGRELQRSELIRATAGDCGGVATDGRFEIPSQD